MIAKKTLAASAGALALAATFTFSSTPASAGWKHHHHFGGGLAVGLLGAAIVGGAIAASQPAYGYGYGGGCEIRQRPIYNAWGEVVGYRRPVRVCY